MKAEAKENAISFLITLDRGLIDDLPDQFYNRLEKYRV